MSHEKQNQPDDPRPQGDVSRVERLRHAAEQMRQGSFSIEIPTDGFDGVARLGESLQALAKDLETRFDEAAKLARIAEILTPEQRAQIARHIAQRHRGH